MSKDPRQLVEGAVKVSSLPLIFYQINEAVNDPESSFTEIARIISGDAGLAARLLKIVNSAFYGFPNRIETIIHAVSIIGSTQLRDLALATTVINQFKGIPKNLIDMESFWRHNIACGLAARVIAIYRRESSPDRFYVTGLLHDIGRLVILSHIPEMAMEALKVSESKKILLYQAEQEVMGFDHAQVGEMLLTSWKLPDRLIEAVGCHHEIKKAKKYALKASIVHVADIISNAMELGSSGEHYVPPMQERAWERLELPTSILSSIINQIDRQYGEAVEMFIGND